VVFNGSPLFTGDAGSGESEIRRWLLENDWLEAIVALPDQLFFNTGISTYVWLVCNHKPKARRGKVQLINATDRFEKMRKSLGDKRKLLGEPDIRWIAQTYGDFQESEASKVFRNEDFGFHKITVERPLRLNFQVTPSASSGWRPRPRSPTWARARRRATRQAGDRRGPPAARERAPRARMG
jgi:type I restriction enzyme M protein